MRVRASSAVQLRLGAAAALVIAAFALHAPVVRDSGAAVGDEAHGERLGGDGDAFVGLGRLLLPRASRRPSSALPPEEAAAAMAIMTSAAGAQEEATLRDDDYHHRDDSHEQADEERGDDYHAKSSPSPAPEERSGTDDDYHSSEGRRDKKVAKATRTSSPSSKHESIFVKQYESHPRHTVEVCSIVLNVLLVVALWYSVCRWRQRKKEAREHATLARLRKPEEVQVEGSPDDVLAAVQRCAFQKLRLAKIRKLQSKAKAGDGPGFMRFPEERSIAFLPFLGPNGGSAEGRLKAWQDGFLAWWESEADFATFCKSGLPPSKGSIQVANISGVLKDVRRETDVLLQHQSEHQSYDFLLSFNRVDIAIRWMECLLAWKRKLGQHLFMPVGEEPLESDDDR